MYSKTKTSITLLLALSLILLTFHVPLVNATENSWTTKAPMQQARSGLGVAAVNGKIYAIGGSNESGFAPSMPGSSVYSSKDAVGTNEGYDPATDMWTFKKPMPTPRLHFAIAAYQNKIYCIGGYTSDGVTGVNEVYDTETDTWETKTPMPTARRGLTANIVGDKIYLIGGTLNGTLNEVYDPETDTWTTKTPSPKDTTFVICFSAVFENKIYVIGGISEDQHYNLNQIYDTETDTWSNGTSPPTGVGGGFAVATTGVFAPKLIYVLGQPGGLRQGETLTFVRVYDPENDSWSFGADAPTNRYNFGVAVLNDTFYVIGGHNHNWIPGDFAPSAANEQYTPIGYIPEFPPWIIIPLFLVATFVIVLKKMSGHLRSLES
jgi:N-acetylneuraminic acid mutarotase